MQSVTVSSQLKCSQTMGQIKGKEFELSHVVLIYSQVQLHFHSVIMDVQLCRSLMSEIRR